MNAIHVRLFGKLYVSAGTQPLHTLGGRKEQELLIYLLLYRERQHRREVLANLLWEESTTSQSLKYLRNTIWKLQQIVATAAGVDVVFVDGEWIRFNQEADISLDVACLEQTFAQVRGIPGHALSETDVADLDYAIRLYQGELLEGWYQDWCVFERERLRSTYLGLLDKLMAYCEAHHLYDRGVEYGTRILRPDRARERTHRRLMRLYYHAGDRTAALRQYELCVTALREELDVGPGQRTQRLYEQIRRDVPERRLSALASQHETHGTIDGIVRPEDLLTQLKHLQQNLDDTQRQLRAMSRLVQQMIDRQR